MTQLERIKKDINEITDSAEMAGFLDGIKTATVVFCIENCPEEVYENSNGTCDVSINGVMKYLDSNLEEVSVL